MSSDTISSESQLVSLTHVARQNGASDARIILTSDVVIDESLTAFCQESGCENYGLSSNCPPNVPGPAGFRKLLKSYRKALVFKIDVPTEILLSRERLTVFQSLHNIASTVEKAAVKLGYSSSKAFAGGSCKNLFCQEYPDCLVLSENGRCRFPHIARPSMSGFGINVSKLTETAGWEMERITCKTDPDSVKMGMLCGLVLIGPESSNGLQPETGSSPGQIGMYLYRNRTVKGYEERDRSGNVSARSEIHRDPDGNMISRVCFDGSGLVSKRFACEVDQKGQIIRKTRYGRDGKMSWYALYTYDTDGYRIEQRNFDARDLPTSRITFYYDSYGERIRNYVYDSEDRPVKTHVYLYDEHHRRVKDLMVGLKGEVLSSTFYHYSSSGLLYRIDYTDNDGSLQGYTEIDCDSDAVRLKKRNYESDGTLKSTLNYVY